MEGPYLLWLVVSMEFSLVVVLLTLGIGRRRTMRSRTKDEIATPMRKL